MWYVRLANNEQNIQKARTAFGASYFPRKFHYKKDAMKLVTDLDSMGIKAIYTRKG